MNIGSKLQLWKRNVAVLYYTLLQHAQNRCVFVGLVLSFVHKLWVFTNWQAVIHYTKRFTCSSHCWYRCDELEYLIKVNDCLRTGVRFLKRALKYFLCSPLFRRRILIPCVLASFVLFWIWANIWHDIPRLKSIWFCKVVVGRRSFLVLQLLLHCAVNEPIPLRCLNTVLLH